MGAKAENGEAAVYQPWQARIDPLERILPRGERRFRPGFRRL